MSRIPPQLGKPVAFRVLAFAEMAKQAWGQEWGIPETVYEFSGGAKKESTDMSDNGIYRR